MHRTSMYISIFLGGQVSPTSISSPGTNGLRTVAQGRRGGWSFVALVLRLRRVDLKRKLRLEQGPLNTTGTWGLLSPPRELYMRGLRQRTLRPQRKLRSGALRFTRMSQCGRLPLICCQSCQSMGIT